MTLAHEIHTQIAFMSVTAIERPLPNASSQCNLVHTDGINALLGEKMLRNLQNAPAMLRCVAPFVPQMRSEHTPLVWRRGPEHNMMKFFHRCYPPLTSGQLSVTIGMWTCVRIKCIT